MKKNMLTVIIAAVCVINLILLIVMTFSVVPAMNKMNTLVTKVASLVDLEIDSTGKGEADHTYADEETSTIAFDSKQMINLKSSDGKTHIATVESITVTYNKKEDDESDIKAAIETNSDPVQSIVRDAIGAHAYEEISEATVKKEAAAQLKKYYNTKAIVRIRLDGFSYQ